MIVYSFKDLQRLTLNFDCSQFVKVHDVRAAIREILEHAVQFQYDTGSLARGGLQTTVGMLEKLDKELWRLGEQK